MNELAKNFCVSLLGTETASICFFLKKLFTFSIFSGFSKVHIAVSSTLNNHKVKIIKNAGWHFNNLLTAEKLYNKLINQGHHNEFDDSGITLENLKAKIENRLAFYNHKADKKDNDKYNFEYKLKKISDDQLPRYLVENKEKYQKWFD